MLTKAGDAREGQRCQGGAGDADKNRRCWQNQRLPGRVRGRQVMTRGATKGGGRLGWARGANPQRPALPSHPQHPMAVSPVPGHGRCPQIPSQTPPGPAPPAARGCNRSRGRNSIPGSGSLLRALRWERQDGLGAAGSWPELSPGRDRPSSVAIPPELVPQG